jgi:hypothetical protein
MWRRGVAAFALVAAFTSPAGATISELEVHSSLQLSVLDPRFGGEHARAELQHAVTKALQGVVGPYGVRTEIEGLGQATSSRRSLQMAPVTINYIIAVRCNTVNPTPTLSGANPRVRLVVRR